MPFDYRQRSSGESTSQYDGVVSHEIARAAAEEPPQHVDVLCVHVQVRVIAEHVLADHDRKENARRVAEMPAEMIVDGVDTILSDEDGGASFWRVLEDSFRNAPVLAALFCHGARGLACKTQDVRGGAPDAVGL